MAFVCVMVCVTMCIEYHFSCVNLYKCVRETSDVDSVCVSVSVTVCALHAYMGVCVSVNVALRVCVKYVCACLLMHVYDEREVSRVNYILECICKFLSIIYIYIYICVAR